MRTAKKRAAFLAELAARGNVLHACDAAAIGRTAAYAWRADDPAFAADWEAALQVAADRLEAEAWRRATEGVEEPVFGSLGGGAGTGQVGSVRKYSDTLLIFLLKGARPEKYRERVSQEHSGAVTITVRYEEPTRRE